LSAFTSGGDLVHYEVLGRGRQVILVHGWVGSWRYWIPTLQTLQAKYRVYALDLFGFGDSSKNPARYTLAQQVDLLTEFLRELGVPKAAFVGHGLGALVVAEFARRFPDRVARMMLVSAPLLDPGDLERRAAAPAQTPNPAGTMRPPTSPAGMAGMVSSPSAAQRAALMESVGAGSGAGATPVEAQNPLAALLGDAETLLGKAFRRSEPEYDKLAVDVAKTDTRAITVSALGYDAGRMADTLRHVQMPTAVVHGLDDPIVPLPGEAVWQYVAGERDNMMLAIPMPGMRHFPMLEYDRFPKLLSDFLDAPDISKLEIKERWRRRTR
jgi:pimeloyl-ACP methyl ester carboxylesterase